MDRPRHLTEVATLLGEFPVVALLGARQVGKTTLARRCAESPTTAWFDLDKPRDLVRLVEPALVLPELRGLVVIDEVQQLPGLFPYLRVLVDEPEVDRRFLVLGSASPELLRQGSETLAGRIAFHHLGGFDLAEVGPAAWRALWVRGGFPRSFLAASDPASFRWRAAFIDTFLSRDLPAMGVGTPPTTMRRFWAMLAHWHGQTWNGSEFGRAFGMSDASVRRFLDVLEAAFVVRVLPPWHENISKRQIRSPKVYVADGGMLHALLDISGASELESHPKVGASWEGFAIGEVTRCLGARSHECFFWGTHQGAELDLLVVRGERRLGFEFKRTATPARTRSMDTALKELSLERLDVVWPGSGVWSLGNRIRAVGIEDLLREVPPL